MSHRICFAKASGLYCDGRSQAGERHPDAMALNAANCRWRRRHRRGSHVLTHALAPHEESRSASFALGLPLLRCRLRAACISHEGKLISIEGDPDSPDFARASLSQGLGTVSNCSRIRTGCTKVQLPPARVDGVGGSRPGNRHGHGRRPRCGIRASEPSSEEKTAKS